MTMSEPRDSPAKRQQFLVICSVMAASLVYTAITSGALMSIQATEAPFPGGNFCYKLAQRDYAVSMGTGRAVVGDWQESTMGQTMPNGAGIGNDDEIFGSTKKEATERKKVIEKHIYHVYLDDPTIMSALRTRWMTGVLVSDAEKDSYCGPLLANNPKIERVAKLNQKEGVHFDDLKPMEAFAQTMYELIDLPSVDSLVVQFPFTDGFVSALLFSYKVRPKEFHDEAFHFCSRKTQSCLFRSLSLNNNSF